MQTKKIPSTFFSMAQTALQKQGLNMSGISNETTNESTVKVKRRKRWQVRHPLRDLRLVRGYTLEELAELTGLSPSYLSRLESGSRRLNADIMQKLSGILGCNPGDLLPFAPTGPSSAQNVVSTTMAGFSYGNAYDRKPQNQNTQSADLPVYMAQSMENGSLKVDFAAPMEWMIRSSELSGVGGAFVLRLSDDKFAPRYTRGDQLFAHPSKGLSPNCWVVVVTNNHELYLGRFLHWRTQSQGHIGPVEANEGDVLSIQSAANEPKVEEFTRRMIAGVYRIIGTMEVS